MTLDISKYKTGGTKDFGRSEDGNYPARLAQVIELGLQPMEDYTTKEAKDPKPRCILTFEFPTETIEVGGEEKPRWYGKEYTLSGHEMAALPKVVSALDPSGEETDLGKLLSRAVMVEIGTTSGGKAKVVNVSKLMKGLTVDQLAADPVVFSLDSPNKATFDRLPQWIKEKITGALDFEGSHAEAVLTGIADANSDGGDDEVAY